MAKRGGFPGGMPGNMANIMKQAQKMQKQMEEAQKNLEEQEVTAAAGGGAVEVTVSGKHSGYVQTLVTNPTGNTSPYIFIFNGYTANWEIRVSPSKHPSTSARSSTGNFDCLISSSFHPVAVSSSSVT